MQSITRYLEDTLKRKVNPAKSQVAPMSQCSFLGFTTKGKRIRWTDQALAQFKHRVKALTGRSWGVSMAYRLHQLGQYLSAPGSGPEPGPPPTGVKELGSGPSFLERGWTGYFGISQYDRPVPELDEWIRRRIRMCYWKQWHWARTKIGNLLDLGVSLKTAIQHGLSSHRCAGREAVQWTDSRLRTAHPSSTVCAAEAAVSPAKTSACA